MTSGIFYSWDKGEGKIYCEKQQQQKMELVGK